MDTRPLLALLKRNRTSAHTILSTARIGYDSDGRIVSVAGTDLETTLVLSRAGTSPTSFACFPLDKSFDPDKSRISEGDNGLAFMVTGGSRLACHTSSPGADGDGHPLPETRTEYPEIPAVPDCPVSVDAADLSRAFSRVEYAVPSDDNRYGLNGIHLDTDEDTRKVEKHGARPGSFRLCATDGSRLTFTRLALSGEPGAFDSWWRACDFRHMLLSEYGIRTLVSVQRAGTLRLGYSEAGRSIVATGDAGDGWTFALYSRLVDGEFPAYRSVIPSGYLHTLTVNRAAFLVAVRQVLPVALDRSCTVNARYSDGFLYLSARNPEASAHVRVACSIRNHDGPPPEKGADPVVAADPSAPYGFNGTFLRDTLDALEGDTVTWSWGMELSPSSLVDGTPGNEAIIMPIRIEGCAPEVDPSVPTIEPPIKATRKPSRKPAPVSCETSTGPVPDPSLMAERDALAAQVAELTRRLNVALKETADLRILLDEARAAVPVAPLAIVSPEVDDGEDTEDPPTVEAAPVVRLPSPSVSPASTPEEAAASYKAARDALKSGNVATMARALARLPDWPSKKASELRSALSAAMKVAA